MAIGASPESLRLAKSVHKSTGGKLANRVQPRRSEGRNQDRIFTAKAIASDRDWQITCWFLSAMVRKVMLPAQRVAAIEVGADIAAYLRLG